jgi:hypothetical protein
VNIFLQFQAVARGIQKTMLNQILRRPAPAFDALTPQLSSVLNAPCVATLLAFLGTSSSRFQRLILISYLRTSKADRRSNKVTRRYNDDEVIAALRHLHMESFCVWLNMPLSEQDADIRAYLKDPDDATRMRDSLLETGCDVIPPEANQHEAQLFTQDLETIHVGLGGRRAETRASRRMVQMDLQWRDPRLGWASSH